MASPSTSSRKIQEYNLVKTIIDEHKFWDKEKIVNPLKKIEKEGMIEKINIKEYKDSKRTPLPDGFEWADVDPENEQHMAEITEFLNNNYVESETKDFMIGNKSEQIKWYYTLPGYNSSLFYLIRNSQN